jgi:hypothetical protein
VNAPIPLPTLPSSPLSSGENAEPPEIAAEAINDLAWWAAESERAGTDWRTLLLDTVRALGMVTPCPVCECEPCPTPSFCQLAREADAKQAQQRPPYRKPPQRPTPQATIEAVKQAVRDGGLAALKSPANRERLSRCDVAAKAELKTWLSPLKQRAGAA